MIVVILVILVILVIIIVINKTHEAFTGQVAKHAESNWLFPYPVQNTAMGKESTRLFGQSSSSAIKYNMSADS